MTPEPVSVKFGIGKILGIGIGKNLVPKKYRYRYRKYLVPVKSIGISIVQHFGYRHTLVKGIPIYSCVTIFVCFLLVIFWMIIIKTTIINIILSSQPSLSLSILGLADFVNARKKTFLLKTASFALLKQNWEHPLVLGCFKPNGPRVRDEMKRVLPRSLKKRTSWSSWFNTGDKNAGQKLTGSHKKRTIRQPPRSEPWLVVQTNLNIVLLFEFGFVTVNTRIIVKATRYCSWDLTNQYHHIQDRCFQWMSSFTCLRQNWKHGWYPQMPNGGVYSKLALLQAIVVILVCIYVLWFPNYICHAASCLW